MITKSYLLIVLYLLFCLTIEGQNAKVSLRGKVVAYVEPNVDTPPNSFIPKSDVLIVRVTRSRKIKDEFVKIVTEYFSEKSPLFADVLNGREWQFKLSRRTDCDSFLMPSGFEPQKSVEKKDGETWTFAAPSVKLVNPDEVTSVPKDKILPCYLFRSARNIERQP